VAITSSILIGPAVAGLIAWSAFNAATAGVFTTSSVLGYNMIDHVGLYVVPVAGRDHAITTAYANALRNARGPSYPSYAAVPEIERLTGLGPAKLGSRYLRIALRVAVAHPLGYIGSSLRQWVRSWRQPNYAEGFQRGSLGTATSVLWSIERMAQLLVSALFLALCAVGVLARAGRWQRPLGAPAAIVAATAIVGTLVAAFIGFTDSSRYAYPYLALVICVSFGSSARALAALRAGKVWSRPAVSIRAGDV
jgi:hypothetical protein